MPQDPTATFDVAVIGGGVIGLTVAWRAAQRGHAVCVLERGELGGGASHVAAGMLAPVTEADPGELALLELGLRSARMWPAFAAELAQASGCDPGLRRCGALVVARDRDEAEALERERALRDELGLAVERLLPSAARRLEPALAPTIRLALTVPGDHAADPRATVIALAEASRREGVVLSTGEAVERIECDGARIAGLRLAGGRRVAARQVVVAGGAWSGAIAGLPDARADPAASGQGPDPAPARPRGPRAAGAHRALRGRLPRPARRRALRARRDDGGARLRQTVTAGGHLRAAPRRGRARARRPRARRSRSVGRPAPGDARQRARARPQRRRRRARVGRRPSPQRHPARARDRRARRCRAGRRRRPGRLRRAALRARATAREGAHA